MSESAADATQSADAAATDSFELPSDPDAFGRLWTPYRMAYIKAGQDQVTDRASCPFCAAPERSDEDALIVHRGKHCFVNLNLYPYNPGHMMVLPYRHVPDYTDISVEETAEMAALAQKAMRVLRHVSAPAGFNLGMNQGQAGGAGIAAHLHQHVIPRWNGDANFFPIIAKTKAIPVVLGETLGLLKRGWEEVE
ncbi:HIT family protein [Galactobacter caseinivorans]|uniref:HIT domain-containing protein n=1 Tax=Galactobacter caseinivorans TaxID=2676123 RepID=A0A496PL72_9MICC|nr:HIT domain-containing protein [Galactobacter caseinivorans]RKW71221.1 HIT domain-containing protein [Galactobacter caseinivorans]